MAQETPVSEEPDRDHSVIHITDALQAVVCPNCGYVAEATSNSSRACPACSSQLLPQESATAEVLKDQSYFAVALNFPEQKKLNPGLKFLSNRQLRINHLTPNQVFIGSDTFSAYDRRRSSEQVETIAQSIRVRLQEQSETMEAISHIENEAWFVFPQEERGEQRIAAGVVFAHPNQTFSMITITQRMLTMRETETIYDVELIRFSEPPKNLDELKRIVRGTEMNSVTGVLSRDEMHLRPIVTPTRVPDNLRKPEYGDLIREGDQQQQEMVNALIAKFETVTAARSGAPVFRAEPKLSPVKQAARAESFFLDKKLQEGVAISCSSCGAPIRGYEGQVSFLRCGHCNKITDLVQSGRLSPELLATRKPSETFVPADYFLQLLLEVEKADGFSAQRVLDLLASKEPHLSKEQELFFADVISRIAKNHPYMLSYFRYTRPYTEYESVSGFVINITFPNQPRVHNGSQGIEAGYLDFSIPEDLRGKVLSITFGDFQNDYPYDQDYEWCTAETTIFDVDDFDSRFANNVDSWGKQHRYTDEKMVEKHWAETFSLPIRSGANQVNEGTTYNRISEATNAVPPKNRFLNTKS